MRRRLLPLVVLVLLTSSPAPAAFATITLNYGLFSSQVTSLATDGMPSGSSVGANEFPTSVPAMGTPTAVDGASTNTTAYNLSDVGFDLAFDQVRAATSDTFSGAQSLMIVFFTSSVDLGYAISGAYSSDAAEATARTYLEATLFDRTTNTYIFRTAQESHATAAESFTLGQSSGDYYNLLSGSLTGNLIAGHNYHLIINASINSPFPAEVTASAHATGSVTFALVPEPSTAMLLATGILALAARRRRS